MLLKVFKKTLRSLKSGILIWSFFRNPKIFWKKYLPDSLTCVHSLAVAPLLQSICPVGSCISSLWVVYGGTVNNTHWAVYSVAVELLLPVIDHVYASHIAPKYAISDVPWSFGVLDLSTPYPLTQATDLMLLFSLQSYKTCPLLTEYFQIITLGFSSTSGVICFGGLVSFCPGLTPPLLTGLLPWYHCGACYILHNSFHLLLCCLKPTSSEVI